MIRVLLMVALSLTALAACDGGRLDTVAARADEPSGPRAMDDLAALVDPTIGSFPPGFTNPGAAVPHGMVAAGPDTEGPLNYGGYSVNNVLLTGLSHIHMSAGVFQGGQVPLLPILGAPREGNLSDLGYPGSVPAYSVPFDKLSQVAEPGYYRVAMLGAQAEITATERAAMHRYAWTAPGRRGVVLEPSRDLKGQHPAELTLRGDGVILGRVDTSGPDHSVYFALRSETPFALELADGRRVLHGSTLNGEDLLVVLRPEGDSVQLKVGLSYVDAAGALNNLDAEMPHWDFDALRTQARARWNTELSRITVEGATVSRQRSFYTALYRALKFPNLLSDADGRYRMEDTVRRDSARPRYTQFSLWDSYRGHSALLAEIVPGRYRDMVLSMVEYAELTGHLPRWQLANRNPGYMSGDPAVMYVAEAWCRNLLDAADKARAWEALLATVTRRDEEIAVGYKPTRQPENLGEAISGGPREAGTTLEYGLADFALAAMAADYDHPAVAAERLAQSLNYRNLFDPETGWIRPRDENGDWISPFQPEFGFGFQEGTSWQYSWLAMHDLGGLMERMGAVADVERRLDTLFGFPANLLPGLWPAVQNQITFFGVFYLGNQYAPGNEHDLQAPFLYNYLGQSWKSQLAAGSAAAIYTDAPNGLPGNDDLGALSGWLVWTMLGLYPINPGLPHFVLGAPEFTRATLHRPGGNLAITRGDGAWVTGLRLNGEALAAPSLVMPRGPAALEMEAGAAGASTFTAPPPSISREPLAAFGCGAG